MPDSNPNILNPPHLLPCPSPPEGPPTVRSVVGLYLEDLELRRRLGNFSKAGLDRARFYLGSFAALYGGLPAAKGHKADLTRWLLAHPEWRSDHTKANALSVVITCFRWAEEEAGLIPVSPYRKPRGLKLRLRPRRPIAPAEYAALMRAATPRAGRRKCPGGPAFRRTVFFLRRTGARTCEARSARWPQVDWEAGVIRLEDHKTGLVTGEDRLIGLEPCVLRFLVNLYRRAKDPAGVIFPNSRGRPWTKDSFARQFKAFATRAGLTSGVTAYCLRHGFTVAAIEAGLGSRQIADQLGHSSTKMVDWYGRHARRLTGHLKNVAGQAVRKRRE